jgi:CubicO group peptidase (beta-lactamase class C family)
VTESTTPDPSDTRPWLSNQFWKDAGGYYKYQWWGFPLQTGGYAYAAHGHLGQLIAVFPEDHLIVVRFGISDGAVDSWDEVALDIAAKARTS